MIADIRAKGSPMMILELGDFMEKDLHKGPIVNPFILDTMVEEGMQAMIPGIRELDLWNQFEALMANRPIQLISSNLQIKTATGTKPLGQRTTVIELNGIRVGLLGIMAQEQFDQVKPPEGVEFIHQDVEEVIAELTPQLTEEADLIVVMACMKDKPASELATKLTSIDVLLGGHFSIASLRPLQRGEVIVNRCGLRGQYFAATRFIVSPDNNILEWFGENTPLDFDHFTADSSMVKRVDEIKVSARKKRLEAIRNRARQTNAKQPGGTSATSVSNSGSSSETTSEMMATFLGAESCRACHSGPYTSWQQTRHATVYASRDETRGGDLFRHVTGFGYKNGFASYPGKLTNVQCEACHGPGSEHGRGEFATAVTPGTCASCHQSNTPADWDYQTALALVRH